MSTTNIVFPIRTGNDFRAFIAEHELDDQSLSLALEVAEERIAKIRSGKHWKNNIAYKYRDAIDALVRKHRTLSPTKPDASVESTQDTHAVPSPERETYIYDETQKLIDSGAVQELDQAREVVETRITPIADKQFDLQHQDILQFDDPALGTKSVAEVLQDPSAYHEETLADPHDPNANQGKAKLYVNVNGSVVVHVMANGASKRFLLKEADLASGNDPWSWTRAHIITEEQAKNFADPEFAYDGFIINGHLSIIAGPANSGKTTIMLREVGPAMVKRGYRVIYYNNDVASVDASSMLKQAEHDGIELTMPEIAGAEVKDVLIKLDQMTKTEERYDHTVLIFDTMKKFIDVMSKAKTKAFLILLRRLTAKGITVICLAHTNKHFDANGNPIFEGVGDVKNDADELIYLIPEKCEDGTVVVNTKPDKTRGRIDPLRFRIETDRSVTPLAPSDDLEQQPQDTQAAQDQSLIKAIEDALAFGGCNQSRVIAALKAQGFSERQTRRVLKTYDQNCDTALWTRTRHAQNYQVIYTLIAENPVYPE